MFFLHVYWCMICVSAEARRALDPLELELKVIVSNPVGAGEWMCFWALSPAPLLLALKKKNSQLVVAHGFNSSTLRSVWSTEWQDSKGYTEKQTTTIIPPKQRKTGWWQMSVILSIYSETELISYWVATFVFQHQLVDSWVVSTFWSLLIMWIETLDSVSHPEI